MKNLTLGQKRVQRNFNPTANKVVEDLKQKYADIIDFLEKGRKGMSSTFLVRLKIGYKLIDAKGVSLLYKGSLKLKYVWWLFIAAMFPILILIYLIRIFTETRL